MITTILPPIIIASVAAGATAIYFATARRTTSMTRKDANILWKLHKQSTNCNSHKVQLQTTKHDQIIGFQCQCGFHYTQKRPFLSQPSTNLITTNLIKKQRLSQRTTVQLNKRQL